MFNPIIEKAFPTIAIFVIASFLINYLQEYYFSFFFEKEKEKRPYKK